MTTSVSIASLDVGMWATVLGALGTKVGIALASCVGTLVVGITFTKVAVTLVLVVLILAFAALVNWYIES